MVDVCWTRIVYFVCRYLLLIELGSLFSWEVPDFLLFNSFSQLSWLANLYFVNLVVHPYELYCVWSWIWVCEKNAFPFLFIPVYCDVVTYGIFLSITSTGFQMFYFFMFLPNSCYLQDIDLSNTLSYRDGNGTYTMRVSSFIWMLVLWVLLLIS